MVDHLFHVAAELAELVQELFQLALDFKLNIVLVAEKAEDAEDECDETAEASNRVEETNPLLVCALGCVEVEAEELDNEVIDWLLDAPTPQTEANYMVGEVDAKENAVSVSKENLLSGFQVDIKESAHPTAESEGHVDLGEERSRASELTELDGDQEDQVEGDEGVAHSAEQTGPKLKRAWFQIYQEEDVDIHGDTDDVGNKVDEPFLGLQDKATIGELLIGLFL